MSLKDKSLTDIRSIAQGHGVNDVFSKDKDKLIQEIELAQIALVPEPVIDIPRPVYDARLMTKPPSKSSDREDIIDLLLEYTARGMHLSFPDEESWHMQWGKKEDTGSVRMPLRQVLNSARKIMA